MNYHFVGSIYHGHIVFEGKVCMNDHFLVVDEYYRPAVMEGLHDVLYCLLMSLRTGETHEVYSNRLKHGPHYKQVA